MTKEEFLKEVENLDETYYSDIWNFEINRLGIEKAKEVYTDYEGCKKHFLNNLINNRAKVVGSDVYIIKVFYDKFIMLGKEEFIDTYGDFKLRLLQDALKRQQKGVKGYIFIPGNFYGVSNNL